MTAIEQLSAWAQTPDEEIFIGVQSRGEPYVVSRARAREIADRFAGKTSWDAARVEVIRGITCVVVELAAPWAPDSKGRVILSPVEPFA